MRNDLLSTTHAVGSRASQRREQEVVYRKAPHTLRVDPVQYLYRLYALYIVVYSVFLFDFLFVFEL